MRRAAILLVVGFICVSARPAGAHTCSTPVGAEVGQETTIRVAALVEEVPVIEVRVTIPKEFVLSKVEDEPTWTSSRERRVVTYTRGSLPPFTCGYFGLTGTFPKPATVVFPIRTRTADGKVQNYTSTNPADATAAQIIYAGTEPTPFPVDKQRPHESENPNRLRAAAQIGLGISVLAVFGVAVFKQRRHVNEAQRHRLSKHPKKKVRQKR